MKPNSANMSGDGNLCGIAGNPSNVDVPQGRNVMF